MKAGRTLQSLAAELERRSRLIRDFVVNTTCMNFEVTADRLSLFRDGQQHIDGELSYTMTDLFHRQLGAALGIPSKYYDKMRDTATALLARNVNWWLQEAPSKHTVRTLDGTARAFLSDRYRRIDNYQIAQAVLPVIAEMTDANVMSCEVTDTKMYIKVVNPRLEAEVRPGDAVQAGIVISNSEVGKGSVTVLPLVYRLVCSNGMVVCDYGERKEHRGRTNDESWELFSDETLKADEITFFMKLSDIVKASIDEVRFKMVVDKLRDAAEVRLDGDIHQIVELTAQQHDINKTEQNSIMQYLIEGGDLSLYGLSSAVTRTSQDVSDYDRATELESIGWQIATMSPAVWQSISEVSRI